jgi:hypothetical protein
MKKKSFLPIAIMLLVLPSILQAQRIGFPDELLTRAEKSLYQETTLSEEVSDFIRVLTENCAFARTETIGTTEGGRPIEIVIFSEPMVASAAQAKESGKPIIYIQGNIHAGEVEGKETCLKIMRDIAFGTRKDLVENQIIIFCPNYNPDGNDQLGENRRSQEGSPLLTGVRPSGEGLDLNREGMKAEAIEVQALLEKVIIPWDPVLFVDLHTDNGSWHGYAVSYAPSYLSAGDPKLTKYTGEEIFPNITQKVTDRSGVPVFWHGYLRMREGEQSSFTAYSHLPRYMVNYMGLRNRMAILSETFAHDRFEKRVLSNYLLVTSILEYTNEHGHEMLDLVLKADEEAINQIKQNTGTLEKGVSYKLDEGGDIIDMMIRETRPVGTATPGRRQRVEGTGKVSWTSNVLHRKNFVPTITSKVPRGYVYPAQLTGVTEKLKQHGIRLVEMEKKTKLKGEQFLISEFKQSEREAYGGHKTVKLEGEFIAGKSTFPKGSIYVDMAQPLAWLIFYLMEPQSDDGLVFWNYMDDYLIKNKVESGKLKYPVLKVYEAMD